MTYKGYWRISYKGYSLHIDPKLTEFGSRICFIRQGGLTLHKVTGLTENLAIEAAKRWIDWLYSL